MALRKDHIGSVVKYWWPHTHSYLVKLINVPTDSTLLSDRKLPVDRNNAVARGGAIEVVSELMYGDVEFFSQFWDCELLTCWDTIYSILDSSLSLSGQFSHDLEKLWWFEDCRLDRDKNVASR